MAKTALRLDKVDLFSALRVGEGEGFDPADGDFINPTFGESGGEGSPLISRYVDNVEPQIPVHISVRDAPDFTTVQNEIPNPRFRGPSATGWTATSTGGVITQTATLGTGAIVGAGHDSLAGSILLDANTTQVSGSFIQTTSDFLPIAPGQRLSAATWLTLLATDAAGLAGLSIAFYNSSFAGIGGATVDSSVAVGGLAVGTVLRILSSNLKAPDSAAYYKVTVYLTNTSTTFRSKFYLGAVITQKDCAVIKMYHDGDSPGWQWTGTEHASTSFGPAVPMANYLFNPRPSVDTVQPRPTLPSTISGWTEVGGVQKTGYVTEDDTSPTGTAIVLSYDTDTPAYEIRNTPGAGVVQAHHVVPGDWVCLSAWIKVNAAAQAGQASGDLPSNIRVLMTPSAGGANVTALGTVNRADTGWQRITATLQTTAQSVFIVSIFGRGNSIADAETRFAGMVLGRGSTQAEAEAVAKTLGSSAFFDGDSLDAEWTALSTRLANRPSQFSYRYTDKPGLAASVAKVENLCLTAQSLEWRDDGAGRTTYRDVLAGRFETDYRYRRAQRKWFSGMIHLWTKPYAHSGTFVIAGTAIDASADDPIIGANVPRIGGDYNAEIAVAMQTSPSNPVTHGRIVGVCAAPSGRIVAVPVASLIFTGVATNWTAIISAAAGGGAKGFNGAPILNFTAQDTDRELARYITTPSMLAGRSRVLAFVRNGQQGQLFYGVDGQGAQIGPGAIASSVRGYNICDLGILDVQPNPANPTAVLCIRAKPSDEVYNAGGVPIQSLLTGLLLIPEDNSQIVIDTSRRLIGWDQFKNGYNSVDKTGNSYAQNVATLPPYYTGYSITRSGLYPGRPVGSSTPSGLVYSDAYLSNAPTVIDLETAVEGFGLPMASYALIAGKRIRNIASTYMDQFAMLHFTDASSAILSLWSGSTLLASSAVPAALVGTISYPGDNVTDFQGEVRFKSKAGILSADLRNDKGLGSTFFASVGATVPTSVGGQPFFALRSSASSLAPMMVSAWRSAEVPSTALAIGDRYEFSPTGISRFNAASQFTGKVSAMGQSKIQASPGFNVQVYAFEQSLDEFTGADQRLSIDVRVRERFTYAR